MDQELLEKFNELVLEIEAFKFGEFTLSSGKKSDYYCDMRIASTHANVGRIMGSLLFGLIEDNKLSPDAIGGLETGAIPVCIQVQSAASSIHGLFLNVFWVRKAPKEHGLKNLVEGNLKEENKVVIIEDVTTSGGSAIKACQAVKERGNEILAVVSVLDREEGAAEEFAKRGIPFYSLLKASDFKKAKE